MKCYSCGRGDQSGGDQAMRLTRFRGNLEIWSCRTCGAETPLLDCLCCERRGVHLQRENSASGNEWCCSFCGNQLRQCGVCALGWLQDNGRGACACTRCHVVVTG